jgi:diadenosine tetraphosphate (Ap4A) HIT family hydrolase
VGNSGNTYEPHLHIHAFSRKTEEAEDVLPVKILFNGKAVDRNDVLESDQETN